MRNYNILLSQEGKYYIVKNLDLGIVSQGENIDEALYNIKEATELYNEDNDTNINMNNKYLFTTISV
ncbi:type II toxin-antitoxin system HicB family antitoxin [Candidatus Gracilibacteria bacterium]|nr:type II toxin-antitoxin system HicB family antitoxin [Candidatus Gracilibacteria bacterium]